MSEVSQEAEITALKQQIEALQARLDRADNRINELCGQAKACQGLIAALLPYSPKPRKLRREIDSLFNPLPTDGRRDPEGIAIGDALTDSLELIFGHARESGFRAPRLD